MQDRMRAVRLGIVVAAVALLGGRGVAQTTQPAEGDGPKLVPVEVEQGGEPAGEPAPAPTPGGAGPAATQDANAVGRRTDEGGMNPMWFYVILLGGFVLLYFWMGRSRRKQEAKRKEMLAALKKGDKVTTIGGIVGTVIETRPEEVTIKVDENNNVRMKFARWAVRNTGEGAKEEGQKS